MGAEHDDQVGGGDEGVVELGRFVLAHVDAEFGQGLRGDRVGLFTYACLGAGGEGGDRLAGGVAHEVLGYHGFPGVADANEQHRRRCGWSVHAVVGTLSSASSAWTRVSIWSRMGRTASRSWPAGSGSSQFS